METNCLNIYFYPLPLLQIMTISIPAGGGHDSDLSSEDWQLQADLACAGQNPGLPPNERFDGTHQISITQLAQLANTGLKQSPPTHNEF